MTISSDFFSFDPPRPIPTVSAGTTTAGNAVWYTTNYAPADPIPYGQPLWSPFAAELAPQRVMPGHFLMKDDDPTVDRNIKDGFPAYYGKDINSLGDNQLKNAYLKAIVLPARYQERIGRLLEYRGLEIPED